jgi:hypothetical protein
MAQDSSSLAKGFNIPDQLFSGLNKKTSSIKRKLDEQTGHYLLQLQKQETKLKKKLLRKDSSLAHQLFDGVENRYHTLKNSATFLSKYESVYNGHLDSLSTALSFLKDNGLASYATYPELKNTLDQFKALQGQLNVSGLIEKFLEQRKELLWQQFQHLGMVKELRQFQKQLFYYRQQVQACQETFADPSKLEQKLLEVVSQLPRYKEFFAHNSLLSSLFALPLENGAAANLQGLQTRAMVNQSLVDRFGSGPEVSRQLQQNLQQAQSQLGALKDQLTACASGSLSNGSSDPQPQDGRINQERTRPFLKRLELGFNMQSQKARYVFPRLTDFGLSLGYRLHQNKVVGMGLAARIGWGRGWDHIAITYQGVSARSFLDWRIQGSIYLSGAFEMNYLRLITAFSQLKDYPAWQKSGLLGLSKRYAVGKKLKGSVRLWWDFLSYRQVPRPQPLIVRFEYQLK